MDNKQLAQNRFEFAKDRIKRIFHIELSIIEQVILKSYVAKCIEEASKGFESAENLFDPGAEAASRFMSDYYETPALESKFVYWLEEFEDAVPEYMKRLQERAHKP